MSTSHLIRKLALDPDGFTDSCKLEWDRYKEDRPDTEQSPGEYVRKCVKKKEDASKKEDGKEEDEEGKGKSVEDQGADKDEAEAIDEYGISGKVDLNKLKDSIGGLFDKANEDDDIKKPDWIPGDNFGEKMQWVAELLTRVVDVDDFVKGMPGEIKGLANHLKSRQAEIDRAKKDKEKKKEKGTGVDIEGKKKTEKKKKDKKSPRRTLPQEHQDTIKNQQLSDDQVGEIRNHPRNRGQEDDKFYREFLKDADPELRRKLKDMDATEFREFYEALFAQSQP